VVGQFRFRDFWRSRSPHPWRGQPAITPFVVVPAELPAMLSRRHFIVILIEVSVLQFLAEQLTPLKISVTGY
jgi:hypothetical protein